MTNMKDLSTIFSKLPYKHHAYGIESAHSVHDQLNDIIPRSAFSYVVHKQYDTLKINDARMIKSLQSEKTAKASLFILEFGLINNEAQNALLKVLEEPTANTYFVLVFPNIKKLLPTLQSRLELITSTESDNNLTLRLPADNFMSKKLEERLVLIKSLVDKKQDEPITKSDLLLFLNDLEKNIVKNKSSDYQQSLESIFAARSHVNAKGASIKMILEMLAIELSYE